MKSSSLNTGILFLVSFSLLFNLCTKNVFASSDVFPFLAEIKAQDVNVRAGQSANFEKLCQLSKGDQVVVLEKAFGWYKINIPSNAKSYISNKYVKLHSALDGEITAKAVNVRSAPTTNATILNQLDEGQRVQILETLEGWYRIAPVGGSFGWVSEEFVTFLSNDVPKMQPVIAESSTAIVANSQVQDIPTKISEPISLKGVLRIASSSDPIAPVYELFVSDDKIYTLRNAIGLFNQFVNYTVHVEGALEDEESSSLAINVRTIQIVL